MARLFLNKLATCVIALTLAMTLSSCFTGIESTPKISSKDVKRHNITFTDEQKLLADIVPERPSAWALGKKFFVTDDRARLIFAQSASVDSLAGKTLTLTAINQRQAFTGDDIMVFDFVDLTGRQYTYASSLTPDRFETQERLYIPFMIELSLVESVRDRLVGKTLYLRERRRYNPDGDSHDGLRYISVTILNVVPSDDPDRLRVWFTDDDGATRYVLLNSDNSRRSTRSFDSVFDFDNPRAQYPAITDENWALIMNSRVKSGMTPDECRLALGAPASSVRIPTTAGMAERWSYDNGQYLIFEDGVLSDFRI